MIVLLDMDGPMASFENGFITAWKKKHPNLPFIPANQRTTHNLDEQYPRKYHSQIYAICNTRGFFLNLPIVSGVIPAVETILSLGYTLFICTSPMSNNPYCASEKIQWIKNHFDNDLARRVIITKDKTMVFGHILVDDKPVITGVRTSFWEHILFDAPYNRHITNKRRITWENWRNVLRM